MTDTNELARLTREWADERGLNKRENFLMQFTKIISEVAEIADAYGDLVKASTPEELDRAEAELIDGIGDSIVTLYVAAHQLGYHAEDCWASAYNVIAKRKGRTINGQFFKDE